MWIRHVDKGGYIFAFICLQLTARFGTWAPLLCIRGHSQALTALARRTPARLTDGGCLRDGPVKGAAGVGQVGQGAQGGPACSDRVSPCGAVSRPGGGGGLGGVSPLLARPPSTMSYVFCALQPGWLGSQSLCICHSVPCGEGYGMCASGRLGFWALGFWALGFWALGFWALGFWALGSFSAVGRRLISSPPLARMLPPVQADTLPARVPAGPPEDVAV
jgi:hypothetical protein